MTPVATWPSQAETWLDQRGKGAWIAAMVLSFIFFWPLGLALLAYMIWSKRMFSKCKYAKSRPQAYGFQSSGNSAFDAYKADTLRRLEEEQSNFQDFLKRLRDAKDKAEFDMFMEERGRQAAQEARSETQAQ
ncbi:MAG: DUF2852 domain-containing protein [Mangrovicoccus sp.]|nr:DUF2852 domain-containing protein [Mangrovicoccus sp.]